MAETPATEPDPAISGWVGGAAARGGWGERQGIHSPEDRRFVGVAGAAIDDYLARNPVQATAVGDRRFDGWLPDYTADGLREQVRVLNRHLSALQAIDPLGLSRINLVDLDILRRQLAARVFVLGTIAEPTWNPLWWNPGAALDPLLARPDADVTAIRRRLFGIPEFLESAQHTLGEMPRPHVLVALRQLAGLPSLVTAGLASLVERHPAAAPELEAAGVAALTAAEEHAGWLRSQIPRATADPRLGPRRYGEAMSVVLGVELSPDEVKRRALADLAELHEELRSVASRVTSRSLATRRLVPDALAAVAEQHPITEAELLERARASVVAATEFTHQQRLMTVPDLAIDVIEMPPSRSGGALAYCEPPGALTPGPAATRVALSGPDPEWPQSRRDSFLREYNAVMVDILMAHEAVPGHALQAEHARAASAPTLVRAAFPDGRFVEGWAVYATDQLVAHGFPGSAPGATPDQVRLMAVKFKIRATVNAVLDVSFHAEGMAEPEARRLLATQGLAEEGEATAKWQRAQTSYGQLATYYLGARELTDLAADLAAANPRWTTRQRNDALLAHGAVPVRHLRDLVGLG